LAYMVCGDFYRPEKPERAFAVVVTTCAILCGVAGLVFGLRWGGYRLPKKQGVGVLTGGLVGILCGIMLAILTGIPKYVIFTVPIGFFLGIAIGAVVGGAEARASQQKSDGRRM
jgi:hypothetical protein